jgi:hypothetical protein
MFQDMLAVPAIQLVNEGNTYSFTRNGTHQILTAPAYLWLASLP